jgi:hypothetical protein
MKPHEPKNRDKTRVKTKGHEKPNRKRGNVVDTFFGKQYAHRKKGGPMVV